MKPSNDPVFLELLQETAVTPKHNTNDDDDSDITADNDGEDDNCVDNKKK